MLAKKLESAAKAVEPNYIEDVFSTYLYTGNGTSQTITNNIDLSTKGGMVWIKDRTTAYSNTLFNTNSGATFWLESDTTNAQNSNAQSLTAFNNNGFSVGSRIVQNASGDNYASWTFRKQPKFFDVVTYTGTGSQQSINHSLGAVPGCIIVKRTDATSSYWGVYHRSSTDGYALGLNTIDAQFNAPSYFVNSASQTTTQFTVGTSANVNASGGTYVAYLFAHNAGGFGLTGSGNVISCGSYTGNGSTTGPVVTLGYEPQWLLVKSATDATDWFIVDTMRGFWTGDTSTTSHDLRLKPNTADGESLTGFVIPLATGFQIYGVNGTATAYNASGSTYIYIAIRRGPMKVPTTGTSVYTSASRTGTASVMPRWVSGFPVDMALRQSAVTTGGDWQAGDRLRGAVQVKPNLTEAETAASPLYIFDGMTGYSTLGAVGSDSADRSWMFRRAPSFFDEVCSNGFVDGTLINHNLGVIPELIIVKTRNSASNWMGAVNDAGNIRNISINTTSAGYLPSLVYSSYFNSTTINPTGILNGGGGSSKGSGVNVVIYLFATCAGVSKVGSYTGTATTKQIDCGFTAGARFVLIKRTDSTGDWYVWDTARGIVSGNDPYLLLNNTAAEVTSTDYIDAYSAGFEISSTAPSAINASGGTFIFLAIA